MTIYANGKRDVEPVEHTDIYYAVEQMTSHGWVEQARGRDVKVMKKHRRKLARSIVYGNMRTRVVHVERIITVLESD